MHKDSRARMRRLVFPFSILALAVLVYGLYGFNGVLLRDYSIYLYGARGWPTASRPT